MATTYEVPLLGQIPIDPSVHIGGDQGSPSLITHPDSPSSRALRQVVQNLAGEISKRVLSENLSGPVRLTQP